MRVLLLVNATASSVTARKRVRDPQAPRAPSTKSRSPRRRAAATPRASRARPPTTASTSSRCSPATARSTKPPTVSPAPTPRSRRSPAARRTCTRRTLGYPARPGRRDAARCSASLRAARVQAHRRRHGRTAGAFLFHTGIGFDAAVIRRVERLRRAEALRVAPAAHRRPRSRRSSATTTAASRGSTSTLEHRRDDRGRLRFAIVSKTDAVHATSGRGRSTSRRTRASTRRSRSPRSDRFDVITLARRRRVGDADRASSCAARKGVVQRHDLARAHASTATAVPVPGRRRRPRRHRAPRHRLRARRARPSSALTRHAHRGRARRRGRS